MSYGCFESTISFDARFVLREDGIDVEVRTQAQQVAKPHIPDVPVIATQLRRQKLAQALVLSTGGGLSSVQTDAARFLKR